MDVEYADDTVLIARNHTGAQLILDLLEAEASGYGLRVNVSKTCHMAFNSSERVAFAGGALVPR
eukprot:13307384-Alexandrium_andersonii.AAC.1